MVGCALQPARNGEFRMEERVSREEQLARLLELSRTFSAVIELEELLPIIIAKTQEVLQAESCALLFLDKERQELFFPVTSDLSSEIEERLKDVRLPADKGVAGWVLQQGNSELVLDVTQDQRFYADVDKQTGAPRGICSAPLCVPSTEA